MECHIHPFNATLALNNPGVNIYTISIFNGITQGTGFNNYIGNLIRVKNVDLDMTCLLKQDVTVLSGLKSGWIRLILVKCPGSTTIGEVISDGDAPTLAGSNVNSRSFRSPWLSHRSEFIWDKLIPFVVDYNFDKRVQHQAYNYSVLGGDRCNIYDDGTGPGRATWESTYLPSGGGGIAPHDGFIVPGLLGAAWNPAVFPNPKHGTRAEPVTSDGTAYDEGQVNARYEFVRAAINPRSMDYHWRKSIEVDFYTYIDDAGVISQGDIKLFVVFENSDLSADIISTILIKTRVSFV